MHSSKKILQITFGFIIGIFALFLIILGGSSLTAYSGERDNDGFFYTKPISVSSDGYAIRADDLDLKDNPLQPSILHPIGNLSELRLQVFDVSKTKDLFVGIGPNGAVSRYLNNVAYTLIQDIDFREDRKVISSDQAGEKAPKDPKLQPFWIIQQSGRSINTFIESEGANRYKSLVVMNEDGSRGVEAKIALGVKANWLIWFVIGSLITGVILLIVAIVMVVTGVRRRMGLT